MKITHKNSIAFGNSMMTTITALSLATYGNYRDTSVKRHTKQRFSGFAIPAYSFFAAAFTFAVNLSDVRDMTYRILYYMRTEWTTYVQFKPRVAPRVPAIWMFLSQPGGLHSLLDLVWPNWLLYHTWDQKCACVPIAERKFNGYIFLSKAQSVPVADVASKFVG